MRARWRRTGSLGIDEWLRYPWFPYNFNLLFAGALLVGDDVLPHFDERSSPAGCRSGWSIAWGCGMRAG